MSLTLEDLLHTETFQEFQVLSGRSGLTRKVSSVTVMDAPDIANWLKGGEILITTGYIMKDDTSCFIELIKNIEKAGAASLFIKINRFIDQLPAEVYALSESLNFPIVSMPLHCAFVDVINPVLQMLVSEQAKHLEISENIHRSFTSLVLQGGDTQSIVSTLSETIGEDVAYIDIFNKDFYIAANDPEFEKIIQTKSLVEIQSLYKSDAIRLDQKVFGYIVYSDHNREAHLDHYGDIAVEHAGTVLRLEIRRMLSNMEAENRHRNEFVLDIISNSNRYTNEINSKAAIYGWDFSRGMIAMLISVDRYHELSMQYSEEKRVKLMEQMQQRILENCLMPIKHSFHNTIYTLLSNSIVIILTPLNDKKDDFYKNVLNACETMRQNVRLGLGVTLSIGVGDFAQNIQEAHKSYTEAKEALRLVKTIYNGNRILFFKDSGVYHLFQKLYNTAEATDFCEHAVGALLAYDKENDTDLFQTLTCMKNNDWNMKRSSQQLYIHYNTMKYRYKKIEEILDINLEDSEERFAISLSIKLLRMKEGIEEDDLSDCLYET